MRGRRLLAFLGALAALAAQLVPGLLCLLTLAVLDRAGAAPLAARCGVGAGGAALVGVAACRCLRRRPDPAPGRGGADSRAGWTAWLWCSLLVGQLVLGGWLLEYLRAGGTGAGWVGGAAPYLGQPRPGALRAALPELGRAATPGAIGVLVLVAAVPPAVWCTRRCAARFRSRLAARRDLASFAAGARAAFLSTSLLLALALGVLLGAAGYALPRPGFGAAAAVAAGALGLLLHTARLLVAHGFARAARRGLALAAAIEA
ncbi:hypothetical protein AAHZ94_30325, partial [Streptomyces sp. HSW2009]